MSAELAGKAAAGLGEVLQSAGGPDAEPEAMPIATMSYTLTAADLAAFFSRTRRGRRQARGTLASAAFASLMALNFLTGKLPVPQNTFGTALEIGVILGLPIAAALWKLRHDRMAEALEVVPSPVQVTLAIHDDRAVEQRSDRPAPITHRPRTAHAVHLSRHSVTLESDHAVLVVPARAFPDAKAMRVLADLWDAQQA